MKTKVNNLTSSKGNKIANQFEIRTKNGICFQSYNSIIVFINNENKVFLDEYYWNYSKTTSKYRNMFLGKTTKEIENNIKTGVYILTNLN